MKPTPPPFDTELGAVLQAMAAQGSTFPELTAEGIAAARQMLGGAASDDEQLSHHGFFEVEDRVVPGPEGAPDISLLICRPAAVGGPRPVIYHVHGGGMVIGNNRSGVDMIVDWARELNAVVVSVAYRLAPEHPHPAPVEDVYAGLSWTADHAREIGGDSQRIVVAGASAGGGLAAALTLLLRDRKGPQPRGQLLMGPMLDDRNDTPSAHQMQGLGIWDRTANESGWTALLGGQRGGSDVSPYAAPARTGDLSGLPPAYLDVGSAETFRDEVVEYASRIWQVGGVAELHVWPGGFHGFEGFAPQAALARTALAARLNWLRRLLAE
ncbi:MULTISPECIES: alpha/beta hydrolase [unclassified Streptomyces]|uniref:alpha/beta hydrolase n=1 Tax=unclassified Streptomyces TaxID=2593676 RepID=UPI002366BE77|nr:MULTISPECIES: alpha/beta hydrolase [unclassified Streptomyces]MDF3144134.1 alpha/beta hydrolase [Streptomyces sp. T21Q-yed]WDF38878.1 alpha/beta hydrolase [Streptomyces sp. T12]